MSDAKVRAAVFPEFQGDTTLLISADAAGVGLLHRLFAGLASRSAPAVNLSRLPDVLTYGGLDLELAFDAADRGLQRRESSGPGLLWSRDAEGWLEVAEKTAALRSTSAGHAYVNTAHRNDALVVLISRGEYDAEWWHEHGEALSGAPVG
jgi:hypothetical protein